MSCVDGCLEEKKRPKRLELANFLFWIEQKQLCGKIVDGKWKFELFKGKHSESTLDIEGASNLDKIYYKEKGLYLVANETIFKLEVHENLLKAEVKGKIAGSVKCLIEGKNCLYLGVDKRVEKIENGESTLLFESLADIEDMELRDKSLWAIDWDGFAVQFNLVEGKSELEVNFDCFGSSGNSFIIGDTLVFIKGKTIKVFDWNKNKIEQCATEMTKSLQKIYSNSSETLLKGKKQIFVYNHTQMKITKAYKKPILCLYSS